VFRYIVYVRSLCFLVAWIVTASNVNAQALAPEEAHKRFKLTEGFTIELFAAEPMIRQPVAMTFDDRGRLWVIQYLQYPNPAGLTPVEVDRYLRTKYDRVPEPPPHGPAGVDKITILEDTDGDGRADKSKDFVTGLNLASAIALGDGGVYVGQAPYLLFYPDRNADDVPDGKPEVLLKGFGLEDAHAVVNSLEWGPDGWLYGAQGSTVTADIRGIGFQQGIWRYHPATKRFELFSEGGGNTWGLDFDRHGNAIAGTNYGGVVCLHQVQGGYYVKGFTKHGPLHNPHTYGYFEHVAHTGHAGGHVTCGGIVYQGSAFPQEYENTYLGANLLSNAIYSSRLTPQGSTFTTHYQGTLLETDDIWFRPIDCLTGPDGSVYVADWYDKRANHVIPEDTWDKTNGRIWRIVYRGTADASPARKVEPIDLTAKTSFGLVDLLANDNAWWRRKARRILRERRDAEVVPMLHKLIAGSDERLALEATWALYICGGWSDQVAIRLLDHPSADIRAWTVRLVGDDCRSLPVDLRNRLVALAASDSSPTVRRQLACTAKRLSAEDCLSIVDALMRRSEDARDTHIPLLIWWAIEAKAIAAPEIVLTLFENSDVWQLPIVRDVLVERVARRYLAAKTEAGYATCAKLLALAPDEHAKLRLIAAMEADLSGHPLAKVPTPMVGSLDELWKEHAADSMVTRFALKLGLQEAYLDARERITDANEPEAVRLSLISAVAQAARPEDLPRMFELFDAPSSSESIRGAALAAFAQYEDPQIGGELISRYPALSAPLRERAVSLLTTRKAWAQALVSAVAAKTIAQQDVSVDQVRAMLGLQDDELQTAIETRWGKVRTATPGEKMSYVPVLGRVLNAGPGDLVSGHRLFMKHCGVCHTLHGEGQKIGPDLTSADRKNRESLLLNILDPSGTIRPEFISQTIVLIDGRVLTGLVTESDGARLSIVDAKQQKTVLERSQIEQLEPAALSLMPEGLLQQLSEQEVRDLFSYLQSDKALESAAR
jgi:putative membrane-bound dehydrogenase-like protein